MSDFSGRGGLLAEGFFLAEGHKEQSAQRRRFFSRKEAKGAECAKEEEVFSRKEAIGAECAEEEFFFSSGVSSRNVCLISMFSNIVLKNRMYVFAAYVL